MEQLLRALDMEQVLKIRLKENKRIEVEWEKQK